MNQEGRAFSGYSTRQGEHLTLMMKGLNGVTDIHVLLHYDYCVSLYETGVEVPVSYTHLTLPTICSV
eukprot:2001144-Prorocentrum_lima.AAC.1